MSDIPENVDRREEVPFFLRQFARKKPQTEQCELCSVELPPVHQHLLDPKTRQIVCSCGGCATLFCGQSGAHYLRVPRRIRALLDFEIDGLQWESFSIPINLAFFYQNGVTGKVVAMYPSPAGAIESQLTLDSWSELITGYPVLRTMEEDVEALLVNRIGALRKYYIAPIDECYRLVGLIRMHWRGLSGGAEVWTQVQHFFAELDSRSVEIKEPASA